MGLELANCLLVLRTGRSLGDTCILFRDKHLRNFCKANNNSNHHFNCLYGKICISDIARYTAK